MTKLNLRRPTFLSVGVPEDFVCNLEKFHNSSSRIVNGDSPDKPTILLECFCVECVDVDLTEFRIGEPVSVSKSFDQEYMNERYVGIYKREQSTE